jgi:hypothetical protein
MQLKHVLGKYSIIMFKLGKYGIAPFEYGPKKEPLAVHILTLFLIWASKKGHQLYLYKNINVFDYLEINFFATNLPPCMTLHRNEET